MLDVPVLLIAYNRPEKTATVLRQIKLVRPGKLYIAADGPKDEQDGINCRLCREVLLSGIDWDCKVITLFQEKNLGGKLGPKTAIDWFFSLEESGIIIEDDILPASDFFFFAKQLLEKYRSVENVMHISAMNFHYGKKITKYSYYFSKVISPWGWASWRRAWQHYTVDMDGWETQLAALDIPSYYKREFKNVATNKVHTWDYQWMYSVLKNDGLGIVPSRNLAMNIGFDTNATRTQGLPQWVNKLKMERMTSIIHPPKIIYDKFADELTFKEIIPNYKMGIWSNLKYFAKHLVN